MATLHPFQALKPSPEDVEDVACVPYDVVSTNEARNLAKDNEKSFLHVIRPEIDLPKNTAFDDESVYQKGKENLEILIQRGILKKDPDNALYIYQLTWKGNTQTGIFGCVSVDDYDNNIILKHELTRPAKEDDRTKHILTQSAHAEPVMLTYRDSETVNTFVEAFTKNSSPFFDFTAEDGVGHTLWKVNKTDKLVEAFKKISPIYIADGHHRCKSASRAAHELRSKQNDSSGDEEFNFFPAVIFPMSQMTILPYNRIVHTIPDNFLDLLEQQFKISENASAKPVKKGTVSIYLNGKWRGIKLPQKKNASSVEKLDAHRLQEFILEPLLDISDPRTDDNISFVGGIRGTEELVRRVDKGDAELAISMYPTSIEELAKVSDDNQLMPPKSTWFEPKLRSGLLVHTF